MSRVRRGRYIARGAPSPRRLRIEPIGQVVQQHVSLSNDDDNNNDNYIIGIEFFFRRR